MIAPRPEKGVLLYDDSCGICRRSVALWSGSLRQNGFQIAPLQSEWVAETLHLQGAALTEEVRLLLPDGGQMSGADVYRYAMKRIWWAYPIYLISVTPLFRTAFDRAYRLFADHRHQLSRICRLPGAA